MKWAEIFGKLPHKVYMPHEYQEFATGCAVGALAMVYGSFGLKVPQKEIMDRVSVPDIHTPGFTTCYTDLLVCDAALRGFSAINIRAINPLQMLKICQDHADTIRVILGVRGEANSTLGHSEVFLGMDDEYIITHCPALGPYQEKTHNEVLELLSPLGYPCDVRGNDFLLISNEPDPEPYHCKKCGKEIPEFVHCPHCNSLVRLTPALPLGCFDESCSERTWLDIDCAMCGKGIRKLQSREEQYQWGADNWEQVLKENLERKNRFRYLLTPKPKEQEM